MIHVSLLNYTVIVHHRSPSRGTYSVHGLIFQFEIVTKCKRTKELVILKKWKQIMNQRPYLLQYLLQKNWGGRSSDGK